MVPPSANCQETGISFEPNAPVEYGTTLPFSLVRMTKFSAFLQTLKRKWLYKRESHVSESVFQLVSRGIKLSCTQPTVVYMNIGMQNHTYRVRGIRRKGHGVASEHPSAEV